MLTILGLCAPLEAGLKLDLGAAAVVAPPAPSRRESKALALLVEEIERRSGTRLVSGGAAGGEGPRIVFERGPGRAEGYRLRARAAGARAEVIITGHDERGMLFGAGRLLRELRLGPGRVELPTPLDLSSGPVVPLRGHQLGYRPKTNSYDGWTLAQFEQYVRDLIVFGTNAIELIPPRSDDAETSPHFTLPPLDMLVSMSRLLDDYGLDVWLWFPALDGDYTDPAVVDTALAGWGEIFRALPRLDHVFVPGGDPGHTRPHVLFPLLERQTANMRRFHPRARMWVSPQGFTAEWLTEFEALVARQPAWLAGLVYGPEIRVSLGELRRRTPQRYPIRLYPDITHTLHAQFPVPEWDMAFGLTLGREPINPRPRAMASIFALHRDDTRGFVAYSEGCNDDVNKIVWSALGWEGRTDAASVLEVLRQYARVFIDPEQEEEIAQGILALEGNWRGPLLVNDGVFETLGRFQEIERRAARALGNWRLQQLLYRAYYDAYVRRRLLAETAAEDRAREALAGALAAGQARVPASEALDAAEASLAATEAHPPGLAWRARVVELADALFANIKLQTSVSRHGALSLSRGANLDTIDTPLNGRTWLRRRFAEIRTLPTEPARLTAIERVLGRTDPGAGGFYDDLGNPGRQPHLVRGPGAELDPGFVSSPVSGFAVFTSQPPSRGLVVRPEAPPAQWTYAEATFHHPVELRYDDLDRDARYRVRVVYGGDKSNTRIRLEADGRELHGLVGAKFEPVERDVPRELTADGRLRLRFVQEEPTRGNGRGCQVTEVWLLRFGP